MSVERVSSDDEKTWACMLELWSAVYPYEWSDQSQSLKTLRMWRQQHVQGYVLRDARQGVVACATIQLYTLPSGAGEWTGRLFSHLAVHPAFQHRGLGTFFFTTVLRSQPQWPLLLECPPELVPFFTQCHPPTRFLIPPREKCLCIGN